MFVYSGNCRFCECGLKTTLIDIGGHDLRTGDIVTHYSIHDDGSFEYMHGLSVVVCNQWQSYSDGTHKIIKEYQDNLVDDAFIMGIKNVILGEQWQAQIVKRYEDVIDGEHWKDFGFNYRND
jgi:hypothetical protein